MISKDQIVQLLPAGGIPQPVEIAGKVLALQPDQNPDAVGVFVPQSPDTGEIFGQLGRQHPNG